MCTDTKYVGIWCSVLVRQGTYVDLPFFISIFFCVGMATLDWLGTHVNMKFHIVISINFNIAVNIVICGVNVKFLYNRFYIILKSI